jgi:hypothetical protein
MKLTTYCHLVPRLRIHGAEPPLPHTSSCYVASLSTRTAIPVTSRKINPLYRNVLFENVDCLYIP